MFANDYLDKQNRSILINTEPPENLKIITVIPCFHEPNILNTLDSLFKCQRTTCGIEVIVLINHSEEEIKEIKEFNYKTKVSLDEWIAKNQDSMIDFYALGPVELPRKWAGVGVARKFGMDEAVRRFNTLNKPDGIVVSLDADTLVKYNYFVEIEKHFYLNQGYVGVTIPFNHQPDGSTELHKNGILLYEKFLEYYKTALEFANYPSSIYTIRSAFTVRTEAYIKRGEMNRRKAGEDFYFLQNLVQMGIVEEIKNTMVFPSSRISDRVPFGTGAAMRKWLSGEEDLNLTYNLDSFILLRKFFNERNRFFRCSETNYLKIIEGLSESVREFLIKENFWHELEDINKNCSSEESFRKRFFQKFNAFKILKYVHFAHNNYFEKANLNKQITKLQKIINYEIRDKK